MEQTSFPCSWGGVGQEQVHDQTFRLRLFLKFIISSKIEEERREGMSEYPKLKMRMGDKRKLRIILQTMHINLNTWVKTLLLLHRAIFSHGVRTFMILLTKLSFVENWQ